MTREERISSALAPLVSRNTTLVDMVAARQNEMRQRRNDAARDQKYDIRAKSSTFNSNFCVHRRMNTIMRLAQQNNVWLAQMGEPKEHVDNYLGDLEAGEIGVRARHAEVVNTFLNFVVLRSKSCSMQLEALIRKWRLTL
jgi:hypothetical protein